jgi:trehalose 6-phosphate phosphatase
MRRRTVRLLGALARRYPVAVISGRAYRDLRRLVPGSGILRVGNHGYELGRPVPVPRPVLRRVAAWGREIARGLDGLAGWHLEHKRSTLSIHLGLAGGGRSLDQAAREVANGLAGARLLPGKKVLNVIPADFPTKGDAVVRILDRLDLDVALFLGDDLTDEDVFGVGAPRVVGVRVGPGKTAARWRVASQDDVDEVLERLVALRPGGRERGRRA